MSISISQCSHFSRATKELEFGREVFFDEKRRDGFLKNVIYIKSVDNIFVPVRFTELCGDILEHFIYTLSRLAGRLVDP